MNILYEQVSKSMFDGFKFVIHKHEPRSGSLHFDLRFLDLKNPKLLHSFAAPSDFIENIERSTVYKTRDHDPRWLTLKSYRLDEIDSGVMSYKMYRPRDYFELDFHGTIITGTYRLMKLKNRGRDDLWLLVKKNKK